MIKYLSNLLDWIYRRKCYCCNSSIESVPLCSKCFENLAYNSFSANRIINGSDIYVAGIYEKNLQKIIRGLKYHRQKELGYYIAKFMYEYYINLGLNKEFLVVPTPMYKTRQKKRKYNHMEIVTKEFCNFTGYKMNTTLIKRIKDTKTQYKLSKSEREENLANAFEVNLEEYKGEPILLLDDICTTGSTFESMIEELHKAGIHNITCFATTTPNSNFC